MITLEYILIAGVNDSLEQPGRSPRSPKILPK
jgi:hypothetical protein